MKKIIYLLLALSALTVQAGNLDQNIGLTNFLFDSNNFDKVSQFKLQRYFVDNFRVTKDSTLEFWTQPTMQNFKHDDVLLNAKNNGVKNIWCFQGKMPHHVVQGKANKVNPIRDSDSPLNPRAWDDFCFLVKQVAIRYADDTQPFLSQAHVHRSTDYQNNTPKAGLGLVYAMEYTNEPDFLMNWSGASRTFTPEDWAVGFKGFRDSIRAVSKTMIIIWGGTINPKMETFERGIAKLKQLYAAEGKEMPTDWCLNFHWYMRNGSNNQGAGTWGISPETAKAYRFGLQMDSLCHHYTLSGWYCTETGWSTYTTGTNVSLAKQNAPVLQGYDIYHSQGLCMVRLALIWGATEYCKGIAFWNRKDNDDVGAYQNGGVNYANWLPKYCQTIIAEYQSQFRYHDIRNFRQKDQLYAIDLYASTDTVTLVWTDQNKFGNYDAKPRPGILELPNQSPTVTLTSPTGAQVYVEPASLTIAVNATDPDGYVQRVEFYQNNTLLFTDSQYPYTHTVNNLSAGSYQFRVTAYDNLGLATTINNIPVDVNPTQPSTGLTIVNKRLHLDGQPYKIIEANSPESRLRDLNYAELDQINACGANTLYATLFGGDVTSIHPFLNRGNPSQGFDDAKVNQWVAYFQYWLSLGDDHILHLLLSEKENHYTLSEASHKAMLQYFANKFRAFESRIIYDREELDQGKQSYINTYYSYLKQVAPKSIRAMHNNTNENPWAGFENSDLIQFLSLQEWSGNFDRRINSLTSAGNWAAYASEVTGGIATAPSCSTLVATLCNAGGSNSSGAGFFISSKDHALPDFQGQYCDCYKYAASLLGGSTGGGNPPTTTTYPLNYSLNNTRQPNNTLQGASLSAGKIWTYIDVNADIPNRPLKFYYDNVFVNNESGRPYELGGGAGYTVADGQHEVKVLNAHNAEIAKATFTVGNIVVPPDTITPPDTTAPPATFVVEYSQRWDRTQATVAGSNIVIAQGSYWFFVREGISPFTFTLIRNITDIDYTNVDVSAPFDLKSSNQYFQRGVTYTIIVKDGTGAIKTIAVEVQ